MDFRLNKLNFSDKIEKIKFKEGYENGSLLGIPMKAAIMIKNNIIISSKDDFHG